MASEKEQLEAARAAGVDVMGTGVRIDSPEADPEQAKQRRGVRYDSTGREMYPWEVDAKKQQGPAAQQLKDEAKAERN